MLLAGPKIAAAVLAGALVVLGTGCDDASSGADAGPADADAGDAMEGGAPDGRVKDAGTQDAGRPDGSADAQPHDGGMDEAGWVPLPGLPEGCPAERATRPETLFEPRWVSCGEGCRRLAPDERFQRSFYDDIGWHDGDRGWFVIVEGRWSRLEAERNRIVAIANTSGAVAGAWRGPPPFTHDGVCQIGDVGIGDGMAAFMVQIAVDDGEVRREPIYYAPLDTIGEVEEPIDVLDETVLVGSNGIGSLRVSRQALAATLAPQGVINLYSADEERRLGGADSGAPGVVAQTQLVDQTVFWEDWLPPVRAAYGSFDQDAAIFHGIEPDDIKSFEVTAERMAWLQGYDRRADRSYERVELWTAPYTGDPAALSPRKVRDLPYYDNFGRLGGHHFVVIRRDGTRSWLDIFDLRTGTRRVFEHEDAILLNVLYITDEAVLVDGKWRPETVGNATALFEVQLDSLPVSPLE